jgi:hypothetical protein
MLLPPSPPPPLKHTPSQVTNVKIALTDDKLTYEASYNLVLALALTHAAVCLYLFCPLFTGHQCQDCADG